MTWLLPAARVDLSDDDVAAYLDCLRSGWLTMGPRTLAFEEAFSAYTGRTHSFAVSSSAAGMHLALLALDVAHDDDVIVPGFTSVDAVQATLSTGARPLLCDTRGELDPVIDPEHAARLISPRTKTLVVTHPFGHPAPVAELKERCLERSVAIVEDATNALGGVIPDSEAPLGSIGDVGVFSFSSSSQLPLGEGGMVVTDDDAVAARIKLLRSHAMTSVTWDRHRGHATSYDVVDIGFNYRLDEPRSAVGISRLGRLRRVTEERRALAMRYRTLLRDAPGIAIPWDDEDLDSSSPSGFPIVVSDRSERDRLRSHLAAQEFASTVHPAATQFSFDGALRSGAKCPNAEAFGERHCILPLASSTTTRDVEAIAAATDAFARSRS